MADKEDASVTTSKRLTRPQGRPDLFKQAIRLAWGQEPINAMAMVKQAFTPHVRSRESDLRCISSIPPQFQAASSDVQSASRIVFRDTRFWTGLDRAQAQISHLPAVQEPRGRRLLLPGWPRGPYVRGHSTNAPSRPVFGSGNWEAMPHMRQTPKARRSCAQLLH